MAIDLVVDASALVGIVRREPGHDVLLGLAAAAQSAAIPAPILFEAAMVLTGISGLDPRRELEALLQGTGITVAPFDETLVGHAYTAFTRFGKGRHPAALNFGDCMVYALAARHRVPILCTGNDFAQTDIAITGA